jgi:cysteine desulfurase
MQSIRHFIEMSRTYLDWASAAPVSKAARRAFKKALRVEGNPSSPHAEGVRARELLEDSRRIIARGVGCKPTGVIFTSGATESNNLALQGHVQALLASGREPKTIHVLYLPTSHASIIDTVRALGGRGVQVEALRLRDGQIDLQSLSQQLRPETTLVCVDLVCGETGTRFATRDVRRTVEAARATLGTRAWIHVDASQGAYGESLDMNHLGADLLTLDAQKVGGVRGIGALVRAQNSVPLAPLLYGGGQEEGLRSGTQSPALAAAFATALTEAQAGREQFSSTARIQRERLATQLLYELPQVYVNGGSGGSPSILNLSLVGRDTDYLVALLSEAGFSVSTKSACETDEVGSRVVLAHTADPSRASSTLRISWGPTTTNRDLHRFSVALIKTVRFQDIATG